MTGPVYALILTVLACTLLAALILPAPARAARNESGIHQALLAAASFVTLITGVLALQDRPAECAVCGALAWLLVMPCVWLVRGPAPADEWEEEEDEDDDGGSSWPHRPSAPPAPDDRLPGLWPSSPATVSVHWTATRAPVPAPAPAIAVTAIATRVQQMLAAAQAHEPALPQPAQTERAGEIEPAPTPAPVRALPCREPLALPDRVRGDHASIVHVAPQYPHATGRRRRASIPHGLLRRCRLLLWPAD